MTNSERELLHQKKGKGLWAAGHCLTFLPRTVFAILQPCQILLARYSLGR